MKTRGNHTMEDLVVAAIAWLMVLLLAIATSS